MIDFLDLSVDLVTVAFAVGAGFFAVLVRNQFKGGLMERPWRVIGPSPLVFALGEVVHVGQEYAGDVPQLEFLHVSLEMLFVLMLMYGFYLFYKAWTPGK